MENIWKVSFAAKELDVAEWKGDLLAVGVTEKDVARNVKRWRNGSMVLRWAVTGLMEAETRFRRIRGYRDLDQLEIGLERLIESPLDKEALIA